MAMETFRLRTAWDLHIISMECDVSGPMIDSIVPNLKLSDAKLQSAKHKGYSDKVRT